MQNYPGNLVVLCQCICLFIYTGFANLRFKKSYTAAIAAVFAAFKYFVHFDMLVYWAYTCAEGYFIPRLVGTLVVFLLYILPMIFYVVLTTKEDWREHIMLFLQVFAAEEFVQAFTWMLANIGMMVLGTDDQRVGKVIITIGVLLVACLLFWIKLKSDKTKVNWQEYPWMLVVSGLIILLCYVLFNFWEMLIYYPAEGTEILQKFWRASISGAGTFVYFCAVLGLSFIKRHLRESQILRDKQAVTEMLNLQYKQYLDYVENTDYLKEQCHDLKHQIEAMRALPQADMWEDYLNDLEAAVKIYDTWNVTGNPVLDAILTQKKQQCQRRDIQLTFKCEHCDMNFLPAKDICSIFGNLLDNAMEATSQIEDKDRRVIHGVIGHRNNFLLIQLENCCDREALLLHESTNLPQTTKHNREHHGIGLRNVELIVKKHEGNMLIKKEDGWFRIQIMIPMK